jgi:uncharacterized glyoxalase superfamily protein PhnB
MRQSIAHVALVVRDYDEALDDFWRDHGRMVAAGVRFVRPPSEESYGTVAVFEDLYGTRWDLIECTSSLPT